MPFINRKTGKGTTSELLVFPGESYGDPDNIGVLVDGRTGKATNRWGDGVAGVSAELKEGAEEETEAFMPYTMEEYRWEHPKPKAKKPSAKRKTSKRSSSTPTSIRGMR